MGMAASQETGGTSAGTKKGREETECMGRVGEGSHRHITQSEA